MRLICGLLSLANRLIFGLTISCLDCYEHLVKSLFFYLFFDCVMMERWDWNLQLGGPSWTVGLGRRDSTSASRSVGNTSIPTPTSKLSALVSSFSAQGLSLKDMVALLGSHTIGLARCTTFRGRIYNDSNIDASFAESLQNRCPTSGNDNKLARLDAATSTLFDNCYYRNLLSGKGLLHSD
ncbi:hypothetical protein HHK36_011569 [Tetracentron sinense]|uniref:Plant heme peroxidase family profile domain-containing protein n=1 Tax=Tetracentron sinense TaxID=13715 RepID=A0A834ZD32_TETSI|nr:hypothetical protein HHK36_011569 [Tetracentron sinense]